jgi:hypothetical protein
MIDRFLEIKKHLSEINNLLLLLPNHLAIDSLAQGFSTMKKFGSVTVMLQRDGMLCVESRESFDLFLTDYQDFEHYIGDDAVIIKNERFEKAVMRISRGMPLSDSQRCAALWLLKPTDEIPHAEVDLFDDNRQDKENRSYSQVLQRKLKQQKRVIESEQQDVYIVLEMLPGASVNCEQLVLAAKFILSNTRKRTSPTLFEALSLLVKSEFLTRECILRWSGHRAEQEGISLWRYQRHKG